MAKAFRTVTSIVVAMAFIFVIGERTPAGQTHAAEQTSGATASCIAVALPNVEGVEGNATDVATALQQLFTSYLSGPLVQVVQLEARLASQSAEEARQKQCDRMLVATLTKRRTGGGLLGSVLGQAGGTAAYYIPFGDGVAGAVARGASAAGAQAVTTMAAATKAKDEMRLEYQLSSPEGAVRFGPKSDKMKAKEDGEDLLTPLVRKCAEEIVGSLTKK